ncbi:MAG TPA: response regulator transcription factor [Candidatus Marinimicrobia bacterium]|nr:response regulator transcription factor [Candidatus Neomarinimicrobiota bacterium]
MPEEALNAKLSQCEDFLKMEGIKNISNLTSIRLVARQPKNLDDFQNCNLILGKELMSMPSSGFCSLLIMKPEEGKKYHLLLAEDDTLIATLILNRMSRDNLSFSLAKDGEEALEMIEHSHFDLLILDIKMPGKDGFQILQSVREKYNSQQLPIIILSSMGKEKDIIRGFNLGADDYILKPFSPPELLVRINRLLKR